MRPMTSRLLLSAALIASAGAGAAADGPFIEIGWNAVEISGAAMWHFGAVAVYDASAPPVGAATFKPVTAFAYNNGWTTDPASLLTPASLGDFYLSYDETDDRYTIGGGGASPFVLTSPASGFSDAMTTLPDDPAAYYFNGTGTDYVAVGFALAWSPLGFTNGTFTYWIREVPNPNPPAPCAADCDANGTLNLDDLDCFVASFLGGCG